MDIKLGQSRGILEKEKGKKSWYHQLSILKYLVWLFFSFLYSMGCEEINFAFFFYFFFVLDKLCIITLN